MVVPNWEGSPPDHWRQKDLLIIHHAVNFLDHSDHAHHTSLPPIELIVRLPCTWHDIQFHQRHQSHGSFISDHLIHVGREYEETPDTVGFPTFLFWMHSYILLVSFHNLIPVDPYRVSRLIFTSWPSSCGHCHQLPQSHHLCHCPSYSSRTFGQNLWAWRSELFVSDVENLLSQINLAFVRKSRAFLLSKGLI
jgi:hypothetical protein